jgi:mannitol/fructose-specific phosphotransferase system IIA component (Ntr-type)
MSIVEYIKPGCIALNMKSASKHNIFEALALCLQNAGVLDEAGNKLLIKKLEEREKLSTTGVGEGMAIPHASLDGFPETVIALGIVPDGVDFASVDNQKVNVVFMIVGSQAVPRLHIQILARIVRLCRKKGLMEELLAAKTQEEIIEIIRRVDS